jgi:hypothetical protein
MAAQPADPTEPTDATDAFPALRSARLRRLWSTGLWWVFVGVFVYNAVGLGSVFFWIPAVLFGLGAAATTRLAFSGIAPERFTPRPGALAAARQGVVVETPAQWAPFEGPRPVASRPGRFRVTDRRVSFLTLDDEVQFDVPVNKVRLPSRPSFSRPLLELEIGGQRHVIRMFPMWDLGATFVGPVVVGEWYDQLRDLGAS